MRGPKLSPLAVGVTATAYMVAALLTYFSWHLMFLSDLERLAYDGRLSSASRVRSQDSRLLLVTFDERTVAHTKHRSPLDREAIAEVLRRLDAMRPRVIGLDILFDEPTDAEIDGKLIATFSQLNTPFWLPDAFDESARLLAPWQRATLHSFVTRASGRRGHGTSAILYPDSDGVIRRTAPSVHQVMSNALAVAAGAPDQTKELPIDYRSGNASEPALARLSAVDVLSASPTTLEAMANVVRGRVLLVGAELDNVDRHRTPITRFADEGSGGQLGESSERRDLSGLEVQAQLIATLLDAPAGSTGEPWTLIVWVLVFIPPGLGILIGWLRVSALKRIAVLAGGTAILLAASYVWEQAPGVQTYGLQVVAATLSWLSLALVTNAFSAATTNAERQLAREIGRRYLPPQVAAEIERRPDLLEVHGRRVPLSIVFTDLAGFTSLSEKLEPEALSEILNAYLDGMTECIMRKGGTLDKFIGDAVVCFWGAPLPDPEGALHALEAALEMQEFSSAYRLEISHRGIELGETRIGVHLGDAVVGNFGSQRRVQYTAMGDAMNLAARLESANKQLGTELLASADVIHAARWSLARDLGSIAVKGRSHPCGVFQIDRSLTEADAQAHRILLDRLRSGDNQAERDLAHLLKMQPKDQALAEFASRARKVGWNGVYKLETK